MSFEFINQLSESKIFPSKASVKKFSAEDLSELAVLNLCALYILYCIPEYKEFAIRYAKKTIGFGIKFDRWTTGGTDLYVLIHALMTDEYELADKDSSKKFMATFPMGEAVLIRWLREMAAGRVTLATHRALFIKMDFNFKIRNTSIRAIRRIVMDWTTVGNHERKLATTRLLQFMRSRAPRSELLQKIIESSKKYGLEMKDVCDMETGEGCSDNSSPSVPKERKGGLMATLVGLGIGAGLSNALHRGNT